MYSHSNIGTKNVYYFDNHAIALIPWGLSVNASGKPLNLITLDHHTDTQKAFLRHVHQKVGDNKNRQEELRNELIAKINCADENSLKEAVTILHHDEHIDAAIRSNIIRYSFSIQFSDNIGTSESKNCNDSGIFVVPHDCYIGCDKETHDDDCYVNQSHQAIESAYLKDQLVRANRMAECVGIKDIINEPYILDIDLDYFHSKKSVTPDDDDIFHMLIANADVITIAREPECVEEGKLDGEDIDSDYLLNEVLKHIEASVR